MKSEIRMTSNFVFIIGTGRCGSTLIQEILSRHSDVAFVSNVDDRLTWLGSRGRFNTKLYDLTPVPLTSKGRLRFAPSEGYRLLAREVSPMICEPFRDLTAEDAMPWVARRFERFFVSRAAAQGRPVFVQKFTGWPRARFIRHVFPDARFIHIVRDGRAVAASWLKMPWWSGYRGPSGWRWGSLPESYRREWETSLGSFPLLAGLQWKVLIDAFQQARSEIPENLWMDVRYEDLVDAPGPWFGKILEFAGLQWNHRFDKWFRRYEFRRKTIHDGLTIPDNQRIEMTLAEHLVRWGYERSEITDDPPETKHPRGE